MNHIQAQSDSAASATEAQATRGVALVTGGSGGIGRACCRALSEQGYTVAVHYNGNEAAAKQVVSELLEQSEKAGAGRAHFAIRGNLSTLEGCDEIYSALKSHALPCEVVVNNAGRAVDNPIFNATADELEELWQLNVRATWYLTKRLVRLMIRKRSGSIINISSVVGSSGNPTQAAYGMTKAAIDNFTKTAAMEFAEYGIRVNSVAPGFIDTEMTAGLSDEIKTAILGQIPLGRMGTPDESGEAVAFLATGAHYMTGTVLHINGGMYGG